MNTNLNTLRTMDAILDEINLGNISVHAPSSSLLQWVEELARDLNYELSDRIAQLDLDEEEHDVACDPDKMAALKEARAMALRVAYSMQARHGSLSESENLFLYGYLVALRTVWEQKADEKAMKSLDLVVSILQLVVDYEQVAA